MEADTKSTGSLDLNPSITAAGGLVGATPGLILRSNCAFYTEPPKSRSRSLLRKRQL